MIKAKEVEKVVSKLHPKEFSKFRKWFEKFGAAKWDKQIEDDAKSGKLDKIANKALEDFKKGNFKQL